jgi:hypothetical protein
MAKIVLDLRLSAHDVQVQAVRITSQGARPSHVVEPHVSASDRSGRKWVFRLPRRALSDTELLIYARFAKGDAYAEIGIRRVDDA